MSPNIPSIWQRSFSKASAVASSSCGSSSPVGTESGLGRSERQLSEEHSSPAPCCCLYRWCSTRNCSSRRKEVQVREVKERHERKVEKKRKKLLKRKELTRGRGNMGGLGYTKRKKYKITGERKEERGQARKGKVV